MQTLLTFTHALIEPSYTHAHTQPAAPYVLKTWEATFKNMMDGAACSQQGQEAHLHTGACKVWGYSHKVGFECSQTIFKLAETPARVMRATPPHLLPPLLQTLGRLHHHPSAKLQQTAITPIDR